MECRPCGGPGPAGSALKAETEAAQRLARWLTWRHEAIPASEGLAGMELDPALEPCLLRWRGPDLHLDALVADPGGDAGAAQALAERLRRALEQAALKAAGRVRARVWLICRDAARAQALAPEYLDFVDGHFLSKVLVGRGLLSCDGAFARASGRSPSEPPVEAYARALTDLAGDPGEHAALLAVQRRRDDARRAQRLLKTGPLPLTWGLILVNVAAFAWQHALAQQLAGLGLDAGAAWTETLLRLGANHGALTLGRGQYWRVLSSAFLHENLLHLGMNMAALYSLGSLVERLAGAWRMALLYLLAALVAGVFSLFLLPSGGISLGASGAILGLAGALLAPRWRRHRDFPEDLAKRLYEWLFRPLLFLFAVGFGLQALGLPIQLDNGAHLGGLLCGLLLGYLLPSYLVRTARPKG